MALAHSPSVVRSGLVLHLDAANTKSYPGSGTTWTDLSGNSNNGTLTNGPTFSSANMGSIVFDGSNDTIVLSTAISLSSDFSICFFENLTDTISNADAVVGLSGVGNDINHYAGVLRYWTGSTDRVINSISTVANTWYHYSVSRLGTSYFIYTNGVLTAQNNNQAVSTFTITNIARGNAGHLSGQISNISIYNRALTASEIAQNFNALRSRYGL